MSEEGKAYNIHEIIEFANRAEFTPEEFEMNYGEEIEDLAKRDIDVVYEDGYFDIGPKVRKVQLGSGIFTVGDYKEVPPPLENSTPRANMGTSLNAGFTDEDGKAHRFQIHLPDPKEWIENNREKDT